MKIIYKNKKVEEICTNFNRAKTLFGGDELLATSLLARINALKSAAIIRDIINLRPLRFHPLKNKGKGHDYSGYYAIDVKTFKERWRIILSLLDENENKCDNTGVYGSSNVVEIIEIIEVSDHYE